MHSRRLKIGDIVKVIGDWGGGRMMRLIAIMFALTLATNYAHATEAKRLWKLVPGHNTVFVDMNSIHAMPRTLSREGSPSPNDTSVDIRLNGHSAFAWLSCDPPPGLIVSDADSPFEDNGRQIGYVPTKAIKGMVCRASEKKPQ